MEQKAVKLGKVDMHYALVELSRSLGGPMPYCSGKCFSPEKTTKCPFYKGTKMDQNARPEDNCELNTLQDSVEAMLKKIEENFDPDKVGVWNELDAEV